jgi:hypothetical protein
VTARLTQLTPYTAAGKPGLVILTRDPEWWIETHAADLVAAGYVRLIREPYTPTQVVGDKRRRR